MKILRSIQTLFPFLHDLRFKIKFYLMALRRSPHENDFNALKLFTPTPDQVFVDIGSNRGEAIMSMLIMSNAKTKIIGFEPNLLVFKKLIKQTKKYTNVVAHNLGLGDENMESDLYIPFYRRWMFDGLSSFKYEEAKEWLETRLWRYNEKKLTIKNVNCQIKKLDDFQLNPYFVKIDVQGYELEVLKGGVDTIKAHLPIILIEAIDETHINFLKQFKYQFYYFLNGQLLKGTGALNTFCVVEEKYPELKLGMN